jgi:hypothetical protein
MPETQTSPEIIALLLLAAALGLFAWWLSARQVRRFRDFAAWVEDHYAERWQALPWTSRKLNRNGAIEQLRRNGLNDDPQFMARYRQDKMVRWPQVVTALAGMAAIGLVGVGAEFFGWTF